MIVAHRGSSALAPENTLPAFQKAWLEGADAIEGDFQLTLDGHIVCIHDTSTERVSDRNRVIAQSTLSELRELDVGLWFGEAFRDTRIPTLAEVFDTVPDLKKIFIELKGTAALIPPLLAEIKNSRLQPEQIVVIAFDPQAILRLKTESPALKALWLSGFTPNEHGHISPSPDEVLHTLKRIRADGFSSRADPIAKTYAEIVRQQGYEYHVWTIDDAETARTFLQWGAQSITTNVPGRLRKELGLNPVFR